MMAPKGLGRLLMLVLFAAASGFEERHVVGGGCREVCAGVGGKGVSAFLTQHTTDWQLKLYAYYALGTIPEVLNSNQLLHKMA